MRRPGRLARGVAMMTALLYAHAPVLLELRDRGTSPREQFVAVHAVRIIIWHGALGIGAFSSAISGSAAGRSLHPVGSSSIARPPGAVATQGGRSESTVDAISLWPGSHVG